MLKVASTNGLNSRRMKTEHTNHLKPGLWSRKFRHPTPTPGNFDYPTPTPTPTPDRLPPSAVLVT